MHNNPILTSANAYLTVTNFAGNVSATGVSPGISSAQFLPLGTVGGTATGELAVKVLSVNSSGTIIGTVRIDQTTPGTTNGVVINGTGSTAATGVQATKTVAATGTPERLAAASTLVDSVLLEGKLSRTTNNTGIVYLGFSGTNDSQLLAISPGGQLSLSAPTGKKLDLNLIYVDVATAADGVTYTAFS